MPLRLTINELRVQAEAGFVDEGGIIGHKLPEK